VIHPFFILATIVLMPVWATWALRRSIKEGAVTYKGRVSKRQEQTAEFWATMIMIGLFGFIGPVVLAIGEYERLTDFLGAN